MAEHTSKIDPVVHSSTMVAEVQQFGIDTTILAVVKVDNHDYRKLAEYIKTEFDKRYGGFWGCIVGNRSQFDAFFHVQPYSYLSVSVGDTKFLIFKAAPK